MAVTKIVMTSLLVMFALVILIVTITTAVFVKDRQGGSYIDLNSGSVSREVEIGPEKYHMKRIHAPRTAYVEAKHTKGAEAEICIRRSSITPPKEITKEMCEFFSVINNENQKSAAFTLNSGNFDLFISNKARFRSAHINYSVDVRQ